MISVRSMRAADAPDVATLTTQLGYPATAADIARRFASIDGRVEGALLVAEAHGGRVVGWIHIVTTHLLEQDSEAEIGGLVVADDVRGQGIGQQLVDAGEQWAVERGFKTMRVRSNVVRAGAHRFYERLGYHVVKTQKNFRKAL
jgi:ribosomal protein S18 acetylase RimI-like enzyme